MAKMVMEKAINLVGIFHHRREPGEDTLVQVERDRTMAMDRLTWLVGKQSKGGHQAYRFLVLHRLQSGRQPLGQMHGMGQIKWGQMVLLKLLGQDIVVQMHGMDLILGDQVVLQPCQGSGSV